jgi:bifunctional DNA-binding transcriptional regulator/antitoxin component of YhaV-PrlF toxin-antitoxin module
MSSKVGPRGQITIDKAIRDELGVKPKDVAVQEVIDGKMVIYFVPAPHRRSLRGILKPRPQRPIKNWSEMQGIIEKAVADEVMERMKRET